MKIVKINYENPDIHIIKKVAEAIGRGKIAIVPGDAVYTLVADALNKEAVKKICKIKKRDKNKPFNLGIYRLEDISLYGKFSPLIYKIQEFFPNEPFTFVVKRKENVLPRYLNPGYSKLGFRIPFNKVTSTLSSFHRTPVIGTSANVSGFGDTYSVVELLDYFKRVWGSDVEPEVILDAGKLPVRRPSTVIEIINDRVKVIREGEIKASFLKKEIKKIVKI